MKTRVMSSVTVKVGGREENNRVRRRSSMRNDVVVCVQSVVEKNNFRVKFGIGKSMGI